MHSLERIQAYIDIDHEPKPTETGKPPAAWPMSGDLRVENLSARYSQVRSYFIYIRQEVKLGPFLDRAKNSP